MLSCVHEHVCVCVCVSVSVNECVLSFVLHLQ